MQKQLDQTVENRHSPQGTDSPAVETNPRMTTRHQGWQAWVWVGCQVLLGATREGLEEI